MLTNSLLEGAMIAGGVVIARKQDAANKTRGGWPCLQAGNLHAPLQ
jgi:hypothetical protein